MAPAGTASARPQSLPQGMAYAQAIPVQLTARMATPTAMWNTASRALPSL